MTTVQEISHTEIIMWTVSFFFAGLGVYAVIFFLFLRGWKTELKTLQEAIKTIQSHFDLRVDHIADEVHAVENRLEKKKVDVILYVEDKEKAEVILKSLETRERSDMLRTACQGHLISNLDDISKRLDRVLNNQAELEGLKEKLDLIRDRQKSVIDRLDKHINGSSRK